MKPQPIETVVIRPMMLALPAPRESAFAATAAVLSAAQCRDVGALLATLHCDARLAVLLSLASVGRANVEGLAERMGLAVGKVSGHLRQLDLRGAVDLAREGREHWYAAALGRVRFDSLAFGGFALTLFAREGRGGASMTLTVPGDGSNGSPI
jgi:DNA-binding transcriptional ArsR family regulator